MAEEDKKEEKILVVPELPTQQYNKFTDEDGNEIRLIPLTEAITEIYQDIKEIKKAVG